jgi:RNA polymerase sigma factor (sigma-70 family)
MHPFDDPWPPFFVHIDSDPQACMSLFWDHAYRQLRSCPPGLLKRVSPENREDIISDIFMHCVADDFRVLRTYSNVGKPFACWFMRTANRVILMWYRKKGKWPVLWEDFSVEGTNRFEPVDPKPVSTPDQKRIAGIVDECIMALKEYCQLLLRLAGEEYKPREIAPMLGKDLSEAPDISEELRQCRKKLAQLAVTRGIDPTLREWNAG